MIPDQINYCMMLAMAKLEGRWMKLLMSTHVCGVGKKAMKLPQKNSSSISFRLYQRLSASTFPGGTMRGTWSRRF